MGDCELFQQRQGFRELQLLVEFESMFTVRIIIPRFLTGHTDGRKERKSQQCK
jgi:hypothetical protein